MRSSIFSFRARAAVFFMVLLAAIAFGEAYCRSSKQFSDFSFYYIKLLTTVDARQAILGDSHVGVAQRMSGYAFLGQPGQQPAELLRLVHYLYDKKSPRRVILQASPQWFGFYHWNREEILTPGAFAPCILGFHPLILSKLYSSALLDNLVADGDSLLRSIITKAHAKVLRPSSQEIGQLVNDWQQAASELGSNFDWSTFPVEKRRILTTSRVYDQNPVEHFETSQAASDYEESIKYLLARGAQVCLFRTPVSAEYIATEKLIADSRYEQFDQYIESVAKKFSARFVEFRTLSYKFDDSRFYNQDHMNDRTAADVWPLVAQQCFGKED